MQIIQVRLENAKSYEFAEIEFAPGVNAIVGHNGAGKSTILEAIGLAVFDELGYTQSEFVRAGTKTAQVTVTIESDLDGRQYDVVRRIGGTNMHYIVDPETDIRIAEGKADVIAFLRDHLGVESTTDLSALFRDAVGVGQGTFTAAFLNTAANRKTIFDRLLQVEDYGKADNKLLDSVHLLDSRQNELDVTIADLRARLEALPELERKVEGRETELRVAGEQAERSRSELAAVSATRNELEAVRSQVAELRTEHGRALERQQSTARELAAARQAHADAEGARTLVDEHKPGHDRYLAAQRRQKELDAKVRQRQKLEAERAQGERALAVAETRLARLGEEMATVEEAVAAVDRLKSAAERQVEMESQIAQAHQDVARLKDVERQIARGQQQVQQLSARAAESEAARRRRAQHEAEVERIRGEEEAAHETIDALRNELARMKSEADALTEQTDRLQDVDTALCPVCEQPLTGEHRESLLHRNAGRLEGLRSEYREVQAQSRAAEDESKERRRRLQELERLIRELPSAGEVGRIGKDSDAARATLDELLAQQAALSGATGRLSVLEAKRAELGDPRSEYALALRQAARKDAVTQEVTETKKTLDSVRSALSATADQLAQFEDLDAEMDRCEAEVRANEESYRAVLSNGTLAATVDERKAEAERLAARAAAFAEEIDALTARLEETAARFDEEAYAQTLAREQALRELLGALDARIDMMQKQQESDRAAITKLYDRQGALAEAEQGKSRVVAQAEVLQTVRTLLRQAGPLVTRVLIRQVSDNARQIFSDIMQDYTRHLAWEEDYGIILEVDGHEREFSQLSGGEQMTAALAVRLALLRELSNIDVAFFDEPTANLDEERRESLARQILDVKGFSQLFVISHDDTFEQVTQSLVRVERMDGVSTVTTG